MNAKDFVQQAIDEENKVAEMERENEIQKNKIILELCEAYADLTYPNKLPSAWHQIRLNIRTERGNPSLTAFSPHAEAVLSWALHNFDLYQHSKDHPGLTITELENDFHSRQKHALVKR